MSFLARRSAALAPRLALSRAFSASAKRDVAKITIAGNLAATPELRATSTGQDVVEYSIASNYGPKANRKTSWFRVTSFVEEGPRRDFLTSIPKGSAVLVTGDAIMRTVDDQATGQKRSFLNIYQNSIDVIRRATPEETSKEGASEEH